MPVLNSLLVLSEVEVSSFVLMQNIMTDVTIYTTPSCHYCHMAKEYFKDNGVEYKEYDVSQDNEARQVMVDKSGQMGVPVIFINGEMVVGFNQGRVEELLQK